jgi:hypothetical protein
MSRRLRNSRRDIYDAKSGTWAVERTARKLYACGYCGHAIRPGDRYRLISVHPGGELGWTGWGKARECRACANRYDRPFADEPVSA